MPTHTQKLKCMNTSTRCAAAQNHRPQGKKRNLDKNFPPLLCLYFEPLVSNNLKQSLKFAKVALIQERVLFWVTVVVVCYAFLHHTFEAAAAVLYCILKQCYLPHYFPLRWPTDAS